MRAIVPVMRNFVFVCFFLISLSKSYSQSLLLGRNSQIEVGLALGPSFFLGDLGGNTGIGTGFVKDLNFPYTKFMGGIYATYFPAEWIGIRAGFNMGQIEANDSIIKDKGGWEHDRKQRNLGFKSKMYEGYLALEIYPTIFFEQYEGLKGKLRPYGLIGVGAFHFNPQGKYYGPNGAAWVDLRPLRLEGQGMAEYPDRKQYSLTQLEIPMGVGIKYYVKENMYVGLELLHRKTFTDYLDNTSKTYIDPSLFDTYLSPAQAAQAKQLMYRERFYNPTISRPTINQQRGDQKQNDAYFSTLIKIGWRLGEHNPNMRQLRCPVYY
jgi:Domain of unknown function (DUF6089)